MQLRRSLLRCLIRRLDAATAGQQPVDLVQIRRRRGRLDDIIVELLQLLSALELVLRLLQARFRGLRCGARLLRFAARGRLATLWLHLQPNRRQPNGIFVDRRRAIIAEIQFELLLSSGRR